MEHKVRSTKPGASQPSQASTGAPESFVLASDEQNGRTRPYRVLYDTDWSKSETHAAATAIRGNNTHAQGSEIDGSSRTTEVTDSAEPDPSGTSAATELGSTANPAIGGGSQASSNVALIEAGAALESAGGSEGSAAPSGTTLEPEDRRYRRHYTGGWEGISVFGND
ncbi:hypothetical protein I316_02849 [Kwoniella heveanensis BCC8398]|uniref:Uncharacterized protein n=1 Tax=Kwoniella heveanensis BCC8398 TaxID=1296120 RepID=A0A1B9GW95_9TREE|nr:hypothetical protein I316_02849 [Kwoniella heveanensis BCC8398]